MKNKLFLLFFALTLLSCSKAEVERELRSGTLLTLTNASLVEKKDGFHLAFPSISATADFPKIFIVYREGKTHVSYDGVLMQKESIDKGKTWINKKIIYQPASGADARDPQFLRLPDGTILCRFFERSFSAEGKEISDVKCLISKNNGHSYTYLSTLPNISQNNLCGARGNMLLVNNEIFSVSYNQWSNSWLVKSQDMGKTWEYVTSLDGTINPYYPGTRINEVSIGYDKGKMLLIGRQAENGDKKLLAGISENFGMTWTWEKISIQGHAPSLTFAKDRFILSYRDVSSTSNFNFSVVTMGIDQALLSEPEVLITDSSFDLGYGDVLLLEKEYLICFYWRNMIFCMTKPIEF
ncbi:sialidase family protein [Massilibacteroides sp.]|uniref:sialidase family protein n=1 Tax=Massilibacteroides sp. TaxID=2034766 RepID=UPI002617085A|nr:sialidase family protein [Massilibacteroides sp.]MDD4515331.1 sialidase family protein [Massilibacteroides sp.]